jgi:phenylacetate-coenzyme A ligase PaaK-like adenylate-forming protein
MAARRLCAEAGRRRDEAARLPTWKALELLHATGRLWEKKGSPYRRRALELLERGGSFSRRMNESTLDLLPGLLDEASLTARLRAELGRDDALDAWALEPGADYALRAFPLGSVLTVAAGNVFIGCVDSVVMSLLTRNVSLLRVSSADREFPLLFAESLRAAAPELARLLSVLWWDSGRKEVESVFKRNLQGIAVWGGQEAISSYRRDLGPGCRLLDFGPKLSFGALTRKGLARVGAREAARRAARDVARWDQSACASPQTLFVEGRPGRFLDMLGQELDKLERSLPSGRPRPDEAVRTLERRQIALARGLLGGGRLLSSAQGQRWTVDYDPAGGLKTSPLRRYVNVVSFRGPRDLATQAAKAAPYLQSSGLLAAPGEEGRFQAALARIGVTRIPELGSMLEAEAGEPHDGRYPLSELVRWVSAPSRAARAGDEEALKSLLERSRTRSPYYRKRLRPGPRGLRLKNAPLLTKEDLYANTPPRSTRLLAGPAGQSNLVFASGGSTGRPKFSFYTKAEFDLAGKWLGWGLRRAGLEEGDVVANLFVAGNLWSSFLAVSQALENIAVTHLPIGGTTDPEQILESLRTFKAGVLIGLPSTLLELCRRVEAGAEAPAVEKIFYAGEQASPEARRQWRRVLGARLVRSAGYASVDAGLIGYACPEARNGEHHAAEGLVRVEIIKGEIVVTNMKRAWMPVIRYRTGDLGRWVKRPCPCGDPAPKFELLGRCDDRVNVGGAHLDLGDVSRAVASCRGLSLFHQVVLKRIGRGEGLILKVERASAGKSDEAALAAALSSALLVHSAELRDSVSRGWLEKPLVAILPPGGLPRQERTGKLRRLLDLR